MIKKATCGKTPHVEIQILPQKWFFLPNFVSLWFVIHQEENYWLNMFCF